MAASTSRGASTLREYNYPLFQRLGFESEARVELQEVANLDEARQFANVYLGFEREQYNKATNSNVSLEKARSLITDEDLRGAFFGPERSPSADARNQARLLAELYRIVEQKREQAA